MRTILFSLIAITLFIFFMTCGEKTETERQTQQTEEMQAQEEQEMEGEIASSMVVDPVCGMKVNKEETQFTAEYEGKAYHFCMEADKMAFLENPEKYLPEKK